MHRELKVNSSGVVKQPGSTSIQKQAVEVLVTLLDISFDGPRSLGTLRSSTDLRASTR